MSECPKGKIRNPKTGRCIKIDGPTAKSYIETVQKSLRSYRNKKIYEQRMSQLTPIDYYKS